MLLPVLVIQSGAAGEQVRQGGGVQDFDPQQAVPEQAGQIGERRLQQQQA